MRRGLAAMCAVAVLGVVVFLGLQRQLTNSLSDADITPLEEVLGRPIVLGWLDAPDGFGALFYPFAARAGAFEDNPTPKSLWDVDVVVAFFDSWKSARSQTSHIFHASILEQTADAEATDSIRFWVIEQTNNALEETKDLHVIAISQRGARDMSILCQVIASHDVARWVFSNNVNLGALNKAAKRASQCTMQRWESLDDLPAGY